jgi:hypothetical protein
LSNCSAFCILHLPIGRTSWRRASLVHIGGGPEPDAVNWPEMVANMGEGDYYGILANSVVTTLTAGFCNAVLERTAIPPENLWVYDAARGSSTLDWIGPHMPARCLFLLVLSQTPCDGGLLRRHSAGTRWRGGSHDVHERSLDEERGSGPLPSGRGPLRPVGRRECRRNGRVGVC